MILDKSQLKYITQAITPEQSTYVALVSNILDNIPEDMSTKYEQCTSGEYNCVEKENPLQDDLIFLNKVQAFAVKIKDLEWLMPNETLKHKISDVYWCTSDFINQVVPLFRSAYEYDANIFSTLDIPVENDALTILNELKETLFNFINRQYQGNYETAERSSMKQTAQNLIGQICRHLYEFRLERCGADYNRNMVSKTTPDYNASGEACTASF